MSKKGILLTAGAVLFVGFMALTSWLGLGIYQQYRISTVLEQNKAAYNSGNLAQYREKIIKIDVSGCPWDFREAWLNYVGVVQKTRMSDMFSGLFNWPPSIYQTPKDMVIAIEKMQKSAERHGIQFLTPAE